ncbi:MAG: hypothetical protein H6824_17455 [Planctomycetaceae bacterium]|nr:hypothetical protein [Planctomycetaceae bacterium]
MSVLAASDAPANCRRDIVIREPFILGGIGGEITQRISRRAAAVEFIGHFDVRTNTITVTKAEEFSLKSCYA